MEYEININPLLVDKECMDEWGAAFCWIDDDRGVEYNLAYDSGECCSAIYKVEFNGDYFQTDYTKFVHYEIDFKDKWWQSKLMDAMEKAAMKFFKEE